MEVDNPLSLDGVSGRFKRCRMRRERSLNLWIKLRNECWMKRLVMAGLSLVPDDGDERGEMDVVWVICDFLELN